MRAPTTINYQGQQYVLATGPKDYQARAKDYKVGDLVTFMYGHDRKRRLTGKIVGLGGQADYTVQVTKGPERDVKVVIWRNDIVQPA